MEERWKHDDIIRLCFFTKFSKKFGIKMQAEGGKTAVIPNLGSRQKWVDHFMPTQTAPVPTEQKAGSAPELVWTPW
jgi:hypothetical protein